MSDGKKALAPCGHVGEHVTTNIVICPRCDKGAVPEPVEREITEKIWPQHHTSRRDVDFVWIDDEDDADGGW